MRGEGISSGVALSVSASEICLSVVKFAGVGGNNICIVRFSIT
jgi:hypothetical protein